MDIIGEIEDALRHHHHPIPWLVVNGIAVQLIKHQEIHMAVTVNLGHTIGLAIQYLDTNGNPMLTMPTPDSPPVWSDDTPATETLVPSADGTTAIATPIAAGSDNISLTVIVAGTTYIATLAVTVSPAPQILGSIAIIPTVN